jgi:sulfur carrier protein ThiS
MAQNITAQISGGAPKLINVRTVADAMRELGLEGSYKATVNGEPADMSDVLDDYSFVAFSQNVKGGC